MRAGSDWGCDSPCVWDVGRRQSAYCSRARGVKPVVGITQAIQEDTVAAVRAMDQLWRQLWTRVTTEEADPEEVNYEAEQGMPEARLDMLLEIKESALLAHVRDIRKNVLKDTSSKFPPPHISILSNVKVDKTLKPLVAQMMDDDHHIESVKAFANFPLQDDQRCIEFTRSAADFEILGNKNSPLSQCFFAANYQCRVARVVAPQLPEQPEPESEAITVEEIETFYELCRDGKGQFTTFNPMTYAMRMSPVKQFMSMLYQKMGAAAESSALASASLERPFRVKPAKDGSGSFDVFTSTNKCLFRVPDYERGLFDSTRNDQWKPHISLFKLGDLKRNQKFSVTLHEFRNVELQFLTPADKAFIIAEIATGIEDYLDQGKISQRLPESLKVCPTDIAKNFRIRVFNMTPVEEGGR